MKRKARFAREKVKPGKKKKKILALASSRHTRRPAKHLAVFNIMQDSV